MKKTISTAIAFLIIAISCNKTENRSVVHQSDSTKMSEARERVIGRQLVKGKVVDDQTRCTHYHSTLDIIAIKFKCCNTYYPCYSCHQETADHPSITWPSTERDQKAILCGVCGSELTINEYMGCNNICPKCQSAFNPNCKKHYDLYFTME